MPNRTVLFYHKCGCLDFTLEAKKRWTFFRPEGADFHEFWFLEIQISIYETLELGNDIGLCYSFIHLAWERFYLDRKDILSSCPKTWEKSSRSGTKLSETFKFLWKNEIHVSNSTHAEEDARPTKLSSKALCNAQLVKNENFVQKIQNINMFPL